MKYHKMLVEQYALMRILFRNDQGVRLLEHVHLLELVGIRPINLHKSAGNVIHWSVPLIRTHPYK